MDDLNRWVARVPAPVRHFVAVFAGAFVLFVARAVQAGGGVDWGQAATEALTAAVGALGVLAATPLTDAYGAGAGTARNDAAAVEQVLVEQVLMEADLPDGTPAEPFVEPTGEGNDDE